MEFLFSSHINQLYIFILWFLFLNVSVDADHDSVMLATSDKGLHEYRLTSNGVHYSRDLLSGVPLSSATVMVSKSLVFWVDCSSFRWTGCAIKRAVVNEGTLLNQTVLFDVHSIRLHLQADWIHDNLYWIEGNGTVIKVGGIDGRYNKSVYRNDMALFNSMALDPREGWIFVSETDYVIALSKILKLSMDGTEEIIIYTPLERTRIFGLTIDFPTNKIFWVEMDGRRVVTTNFDGSDATHMYILPTSTVQKDTIVISGDFIVVTGGGSHLRRLDKLTGANKMQFINSNNVLNINSMVMFDEENQPKGCNYCGEGNKTACSYICVTVPRKTRFAMPYRCMCPDDKPSCAAKEITEIFEKQNTCAKIQHFSVGHCPYPNCTKSGEFGIQQCDTINGHIVCWCSEKHGIIVPGTKQNYGEGPYCEQSLSPCLYELVLYKRDQSLLDFEPRCTPSGEFEDVQCDSDSCWCVDEMGNPTSETTYTKSEEFSCKESFQTHFFVTMSILIVLIGSAIIGFIVYRRRLQEDLYTDFLQTQVQLYSELAAQNYEDVSDIDLPVLLQSVTNAEYEVPSTDNQQQRQSKTVKTDEAGYLKSHVYQNSMLFWKHVFSNSPSQMRDIIRKRNVSALQPVEYALPRRTKPKDEQSAEIYAESPLNINIIGQEPNDNTATLELHALEESE